MSEAAQLYEWANRWLPPTLQALADFLTVVIASITLYGIFKYRKRLPTILKTIIAHHLSDRFDQVRSTLDQIRKEEIVKKDAVRVRNLFSVLSGQLMPLCALAPRLSAVQGEVDQVASGAIPVNEGIKLKLVHRIEGELANTKVQGLVELAKESTSG